MVAAKAAEEGKLGSGQPRFETLTFDPTQIAQISPFYRSFSLGIRWVVSNPKFITNFQVLTLDYTFDCYACRIYSLDYI